MPKVNRDEVAPLEIAIHPVEEDDKGNITRVGIYNKKSVCITTIDQQQAFKLVSELYQSFHGQMLR